MSQNADFILCLLQKNAKMKINLSEIIKMTKVVQQLYNGSIDIIGDIHGEKEALFTLIRSLGYDSEGNHPEHRKLVFVGDLCDRGPDSPAVILFVKKLVENNNAQAILGNHEINLLQGKPKESSGWYFSERFESDAKYQPFKVATEAEKEEIFNFLSTLPVILENKSLRIVHAAWVHENVEKLRGIESRDFVNFINEKDNEVNAFIKTTGLLDNYQAEQNQWLKEIEDPDSSCPYLENTANYNLAHQEGNPIRKITCGSEIRNSEPFFTSGKWRFISRHAWWQDYNEEIPVIIGHYWRKTHEVTDSENLFDSIAYNSWHGKLNNVFCIDYSVGARFQERNKNKTIGSTTNLAALRWPENTIMFERGNTVPTIGFKDSADKKKRYPHI